MLLSDSMLLYRFAVVVVLLFYVRGKHLRSCWDGLLTLLTIALLESAEGETKVCGQTGH